MNNIDIAKGIVFQKLGIKNDSFEDRLISQKKIYLLQSLGTDLGYEYNWYVRGPYSPSLTNYIYNNIDVLSVSDFSKYKLSAIAEKNLDLVNKLSELKSETNLSTSSWYELLASLLYIKNNSSSWGVSNSDSIFEKLIDYKPQYSNQQCKSAYDVLIKQGLINQEEKNGET